MSARFLGSAIGVVVLGLVGTSLSPADAAQSNSTQSAAAPAQSAVEPGDLVRFKITAPAKVNLKPGKWKSFRVALTNRESSSVANVRLHLKGKGITAKSKAISFGTIGARATKTRTVTVRVKGKPERLLTYSVTSIGETYDTETTRLLPKYKRKPARPGKYRGKASGRTVKFKVTKARRVVGWRTSMQLVCGGWPDPLTYPVVTLDFPRKVKIPKGGRIDARFKGKNFTVNLRATFDGAKVRDGYFRYSGPNRCRGTVNWKARRTGK